MKERMRKDEVGINTKDNRGSREALVLVFLVALRDWNRRVQTFVMSDKVMRYAKNRLELPPITILVFAGLGICGDALVTLVYAVPYPIANTSCGSNTEVPWMELNMRHSAILILP